MLNTKPRPLTQPNTANTQLMGFKVTPVGMGSVHWKMGGNICRDTIPRLCRGKEGVTAGIFLEEPVPGQQVDALVASETGHVADRRVNKSRFECG